MSLPAAYYALIVASGLTALLFIVDHLIQKQIGDTADLHEDTFREIEQIGFQVHRLRDERIEVKLRHFRLALPEGGLSGTDLKILAWELNRYRMSDVLVTPLEPVEGVLGLPQAELAEHYKSLSAEIGKQSKALQRDFNTILSRQVYLAQREKRLNRARNYLIVFLQLSILAFVIIDKLPRSSAIG